MFGREFGWAKALARAMGSPRLQRCVAVVVASSCASVAGAAAIGEQIYKAKCAECHGAQGDGVEGKYREALYGDWGLPKLTRYIAKNMPEDSPDTLSVAEAEAVSAYVFDAFYSRAAQARLRPARVELAHLTKAQYANVIADVLADLTGDAEANRKEAGAQVSGGGLVSYYFSTAQRGRFDASKIVHTGVDGTVDLGVTEGSKGKERVGQFEQFSVQWRGAIVAEETGEYEFVVRTPNSVRVWINSEFVPGEAVLDVNVNRPDEPDHRVTVRLLGGRSYPIGIDFWALPGKAGAPSPSIVLRWKPPHGVERTVPARSLRPAKVRPTFVVATRFPAGDSSRGYERAGALSKDLDAATTSAAFEVANTVVRRMDRLAGTRAGSGGTAAAERKEKVMAMAERLVAGFFRRPLTAEEKARFVTAKFAGVATGATGGAGEELEGALKKVVLLALKAPQFLYAELPAVAETAAGLAHERHERHEKVGAVGGGAGGQETHGAGGLHGGIGEGGAELRGAAALPATVAGRLARGLWDSVADRELMRAAAEGKLRTRAEVAAQARRMLGDARARAKLREFFQHWLQLRFVEGLEKDAMAHPDFTAELIDDLRTSLVLFLDDVAWSARADFRELLRADGWFVNERLAKFYGLPAGARGVAGADEFVKVAVPDGHRAGVLTHPYVLAAFSYKNATSPIHRGVFLTRSVVGRTLKSPPTAVAFDESEFSPEMTMREKVAKLTKSEACQGCHAVINPLGFSLEWFDEVGRFRRQDKGRPVDALSEYLTDEGAKVRFATPRDVADFAIGSEQANFGLIEQLFNHVVKQPVAAFGPEALPRLREAFVASGYNLQALLVEIVFVSAVRGVEPALAANTP